MPITLTDARRYVAAHHRHNAHAMPPSWFFGVGVEQGSGLVGVGIAGRPSGRGLDNGRNIEVTRCCVIEAPNACSMIYGALCRAGKALGREKAYTYTLASEDGASVRAAGFVFDAFLPAREAMTRNDSGRYETDLFGNNRCAANEDKIRWLRVLNESPAPIPPTPEAK